MQMKLLATKRMEMDQKKLAVIKKVSEIQSSLQKEISMERMVRMSHLRSKMRVMEKATQNSKF